jgi:hypothetical protein
MQYLPPCCQLRHFSSKTLKSILSASWYISEGLDEHSEKWNEKYLNKLQNHLNALAVNLLDNSKSVNRLKGYSVITAVARVRARVWSCGICGGQSGTVAGFLRLLRFPLPIFISPIAPQSQSSIIWPWYNRTVVAAVPSVLGLTPQRNSQ